jgi:hypothetical protein
MSEQPTSSDPEPAPAIAGAGVPLHPAAEQLRQALRGPLQRDIDPMAATWREIAPGVTELLGGPFSTDTPAHTTLAMLLAATFGERICRDLSGFWFQNRAVPDGAAIGFPETTIMFSPLEVVVQALARAQLAMLDDVTKDLGGAVARARLEAQSRPGGATLLGPEDYQRMFDPGFVQFACLDLGKVRAALARTPPESAREISQALSRLPAAVPEHVRASMRDQIVGALGGLSPEQSVSAQVAQAPPLVELLALLEGAVETTRFAPAELWHHVLLPLLHIGPAETFPPLDQDDQAALRDGADPLVLYVETVPFRTPSTDEDGVLGVFPAEQLGVLDPCFAGLPTIRLVTAPTAPLQDLCAGLDRAGVRAALGKFTRHAIDQALGPDAPAPNVDSSLLAIALELLGELGRVVESVGEASPGERVLCLRRAPEAEAASDAALQELRRALQGPRIILV